MWVRSCRRAASQRRRRSERGHFRLHQARQRPRPAQHVAADDRGRLRQCPARRHRQRRRGHGRARRAPRLKRLADLRGLVRHLLSVQQDRAAARQRRHRASAQGSARSRHGQAAPVRAADRGWPRTQPPLRPDLARDQSSVGHLPAARRQLPAEHPAAGLAHLPCAPVAAGPAGVPVDGTGRHPGLPPHQRRVPPARCRARSAIRLGCSMPRTTSSAGSRS